VVDTVQLESNTKNAKKAIRGERRMKIIEVDGMRRVYVRREDDGIRLHIFNYCAERFAAQILLPFPKAEELLKAIKEALVSEE
jgi:hypothetical protein